LGDVENQIENKKKLLNLILEKIPLLFLVVGSCIVTLTAQKLAGAIVSIESVSSATRISNAMVSYLRYLEKMVWPKDFSVFYPYPIDELYIWKGLVSGFVLTGITIVILRLIKKAPYLSVGWFWYLGTLIPVIGLVQVGQQAMADRYAYIPLIGIFIIIAWGLPDFLKNFHFKKPLLLFLVLIFFSVLMRLSWVQLHYWQNSEKLFNHAIEVTDKKYPSFVGIYNNLGVVLNKQLKFKEAMVHLKSAVKLQPTYSEAHNNLGNALSGLNRSKEANIYYKEAIRLNPNYPEAHNNLANSLSKQLRLDEAIIYYKKAIQLKPEYYEAHFNFGVTLNKWNRSEQAIGYLKEAIRLNPNFTKARLSLGNILMQKYKFKTAIHHFKTIIKVNPNHAIAHNSLGSALAEQGNFEQAIVHFHTSITINPRYLEAHQNLGTMFLILGQPEQSVVYFKIAKELAMNEKLKQ
jgi:tetratricopeptide (TPR) repeat protein